MNNLIILTLYLTVLLQPMTVLALQQQDPCLGPSAMHQGICVNNKLELADTELHNAYQAAIVRIKHEDQFLNRNLQHSFSKSQRAWLKYTETYCEFKGNSTGAAGGWSGVHTENCVLDMINQRITYLERVFSG
ncbi:MAG: DUF1311 domain-containing protein [Gammaproteobacteria bacterium]|nr:DUF1311 domain-containing protein [Gammaproteobacteria bacterium]